LRRFVFGRANRDLVAMAHQLVGDQRAAYARADYHHIGAQVAARVWPPA
jgi:hypothetical protein